MPAMRALPSTSRLQPRPEPHIRERDDVERREGAQRGGHEGRQRLARRPAHHQRAAVAQRAVAQQHVQARRGADKELGIVVGAVRGPAHTCQVSGYLSALSTEQRHTCSSWRGPGGRRVCCSRWRRCFRGQGAGAGAQLRWQRGTKRPHAPQPAGSPGPCSRCRPSGGAPHDKGDCAVGEDGLLQVGRALVDGRRAHGQRRKAAPRVRQHVVQHASKACGGRGRRGQAASGVRGSDACAATMPSQARQCYPTTCQRCRAVHSPPHTHGRCVMSRRGSGTCDAFAGL